MEFRIHSTHNHIAIHNSDYYTVQLNKLQLNGHASDRGCTHAILSTLMIKLTEAIIYFCKTNVGTP
jgi:hypothetical protein